MNDIRAEKLTVNLWVAVGILFTGIGTAFGLGIGLAMIKNDIVNMKSSIVEVQSSLNNREFFRRADMEEWCREFKSQNPSTRCPNPYELRTYIRRFGKYGQIPARR